jgi:pyruvate dehydrogenase E1 component alpha subunit
MHLFAKEHLAASSGIVGAAGPTAAGFALAAQVLRPGTLVVAFFGEGAVNQGMLMESMNLASVWSLPVLFVCKDDSWSITARSKSWTGAQLSERARGLGLTYLEVDGLDAAAVWRAAETAISEIRGGQGPIFLHAHCVHAQAHFLGFPILRAFRHPLRELPSMVAPLLRAGLHLRGEPPRQRRLGLAKVLRALYDIVSDPRRASANDPIERVRRLLKDEPDRLAKLEHRLEHQVAEIVWEALEDGSAEAGD